MNALKRGSKFILKCIAKLIKVLLILAAARWVLLSLFSNEAVCPWCLYPHVIHDYYAATGIRRDTLYCHPAEVKKIYGEPEQILVEVSDYSGEIREIYVYDGFGIVFGYRDPMEEAAEDCKALGFALYSPDIKIRWDIHVGSTRRQIVHAYWKSPAFQGGGDQFWDGYINMWDNGLDFSYDENDMVTSIIYIP